MAAERSWSVHIAPYPEVSTNDLTLDEVAIAEQVCGVPYTVMNPHASVKVAKALLTLLMIRAGEPKEEALARAGTSRLEVLHGAFRFHPGDDTTGEQDGDPGPPSSAPTSAIG